MDIIGGQQLLDRTFHIQPVGIVTSIAFVRHGMYLAFNNKFIIIQVAAIRRHAEIITHILTAQAFLAGHQRFIQLFAVASTDDIRARIAEQPLHSLRQITDGGSVCLLNEQIARLGVPECKHHQIDRLV